MFMSFPNWIFFLFLTLASVVSTAAPNCVDLFSERFKFIAPKVIVISAPSGGGKTTLMRKLIEEYPQDFQFSISTTTRSPRPGERNGKDYFFTNTTDFQQMIKENHFLEWAQVHNNFYGTSKSSVENILKSGKSAILVVDVQGAESIRQALPGQTLSIFISPPNMKILEERLKSRGTDSEEVISHRLKNAKKEMEQSNKFNATVINDDLKIAYSDLKIVLQKLFENLP